MLGSQSAGTTWLQLLAAVGALAGFSALVVPLITQRVQDRRRRRELKAELVKDMSENVTSLVRFVQYMDIGAKPEAERQKEESRLGFWIGDWERQVMLIWARLVAYFPDESIGDDWIKYADILRHFYNLSWVGTLVDLTGSPEEEWSVNRQTEIEGIRKSFGHESIWNEDLWRKLDDVGNKKHYMQSWTSIERIVTLKLPHLLREILRSPMELGSA